MTNYISSTEAAKILKVSSVTIFNMIQDGRIKAIKVGRNYIIDKTLLQENFIADYKKIILPILKKHGVVKAAIFGSTVRGTRRKNSDLDLLVQMKVKGLLERVCLKRELEKAIHQKVDLGTFGGIYPKLRDHILNEAIYIL